MNETSILTIEQQLESSKRNISFLNDEIKYWRDKHNKLQAENARLKKDIRLNRPDLQMILTKYSDFLHKQGYIDTDYYAEKPLAVDAFLDDYFKDKE